MKKISRSQCEELLKPFTDPDWEDKGLHQVFQCGENAVATDAHVLVCVPQKCAEFSISELPEARLSVVNLEEINQRAKANITAVHRLDLEMAESVWCDAMGAKPSYCTCDGGSVPGTRKTCPSCKGKGGSFCDCCGQEINCIACNEGTLPGVSCLKCSGDNPRVLFRLGAAIVTRKLLEPISKLPGACVAMAGDKDEPVWFRWQFGYGAVMPISQDGWEDA
ncbi:hypothetical protein GYB59_00630 [bacterium]|nr:hypothetical protein [bacterium]